MKLTYKDQTIEIVPYECNPIDKFPLFINITNNCNAKCEFCANACNNKDLRKIDLNELENVLKSFSKYIDRVSISGGEPMININELKKVLKLVNKYVNSMTINTNGFFLKKNIELLNKYKLSSLQISRHHYDDDKNNEIFKIKTIGFEDLKNLKSKNMIRLNCLLIKGYIDSGSEVIKYLEKAGEVNAEMVVFVSMMKINNYTKDNFVDYSDILPSIRPSLSKISECLDGNRCRCERYLYLASSGNLITVYFKHTFNAEYSGRALLFDTNGVQKGY